METLTLRLLGTGDAFGSGGRFQTCFHLTDGRRTVLIDCGASSLSAIKSTGIDPTSIDIILLSHLHGDHFGGVPFVLLDAGFATPRTQPIIVAGPPGVEQRVFAALDVMFPNASERVRTRVPVVFQELTAGAAQRVGELEVTPFDVIHPSGSSSFALRIGWHSKAIGFSGDTEWTDALLSVAHDADLFLCECYTYERQVPFHLSYRLIAERLASLGAKRVVLTHMSADMLAHASDAQIELAKDGMIVVID